LGGFNPSIGVKLMKQASYFKPALIGGCIAGFLSAIPIVELACCLVISGVIDFLFSIIGLGAGMVFLERLADRIPQFEEYIGMATIGMGIMIVGFFLSFIIFAIFGTLGGVIGTAIFAKKEKEPTTKA